MASTDLAVREQNDYMPVMSIDQAVERREMLVEYTRRLMVEGQDFGVIPGAGAKKVLFKPGAEKLTTIFGLTPKFEIVQQIEQWETDANGELLFSYVYRCSLYRGDRLLANADGSCNSREKKYRYRKAERVCPQCSQPYIIKGKAEFGGGWLCWKAKGGCGAKFREGDPSIESQQVGDTINPDVPDLINTLQKMAQKRALIAATLIGVNASEFFTQDMLDEVDHAPHLRHPDPESIPEGHTSAEDHDIQAAHAAAQEEAERREEEEKRVRKEAALNENREAFAQFADVAERCHFDRTDKASLGALAKIICKKDRPSAADLKAVCLLRSADWNAAIDEANAQLGKKPDDDLTETERKAEAILSEADSARTVEAMSR